MARNFYTDADMNLNEILNHVLEQLGAAPGTITEGRIYQNTSDNKAYLGSSGAYKALAFEEDITAALAGLDWKESVVAATTAAGTLATDFENGDTIDGVTLVTGDRILIKDQATGAENGVYVVAATGAPTRAEDFDADAEVAGVAIVPVEGGTQIGTYRMNESNPTIGTTALTFSTFGASVSAASDTVAGVVELATTAEVVTGTDTTRAVTPAALKGAGYVAQYPDTFVVGDWTAGTPNTLVVTAATHGLNASENIQAVIYEGQEEVIVDVTVAAGGDVTFSSSATFAGHYVLQGVLA